MLSTEEEWTILVDNFSIFRMATTLMANTLVQEKKIAKAKQLMVGVWYLLYTNSKSSTSDMSKSSPVG